MTKVRILYLELTMFNGQNVSLVASFLKSLGPEQFLNSLVDALHRLRTWLISGFLFRTYTATSGHKIVPLSRIRV